VFQGGNRKSLVFILGAFQIAFILLYCCVLLLARRDLHGNNDTKKEDCNDFLVTGTPEPEWRCQWSGFQCNNSVSGHYKVQVPYIQVALWW